MKACPKCRIGTITLEPVLIIKNVVTSSEHDGPIQAAAEQLAIVSCSACDLNVRGKLENATIGPDGTFTGGHFVEVRDVGKNQ